MEVEPRWDVVLLMLIYLALANRAATAALEAANHPENARICDSPPCRPSPPQLCGGRRPCPPTVSRTAKMTGAA